MDILQHIKAEWGYSRRRRETVKLRRDVYQHDWEDQLRDEVQRQFLPENANKLLQRADTSMNVLRWAVDQIAAIYSRPVGRMVGEDLMAPMPEVDLALDLASKLTFYQGECLVRPFWTGDRLLLDVIPGDRFHVIPDKVDRLKLQAVVISHTNSRSDVIAYEVWTPEHHFHLDKGWNIKTPAKLDVDADPHRNPYGVVPYVCTHTCYPTGSFWHWHEAQGLHDATLHLGVAMTDWGHLRHLQSFKQLWIRSEGKGRSKMARVAVDPSSVLTLQGPTSAAGVLDMQADLTGQLEALLSKAEAILQLYGISPEVARGTEQAQSGYALKLKLHGLQERWEEQRQLWRLWERELWKLARVTLPAEGGPALPDGPLTLAWPELGPGRDPVELSNLATQQYGAGLISRAEGLRMTGRDAQAVAAIEMEILDEKAAGTQAETILPELPPDELGGET